MTDIIKFTEQLKEEKRQEQLRKNLRPFAEQGIQWETFCKETLFPADAVSKQIYQELQARYYDPETNAPRISEEEKLEKEVSEALGLNAKPLEFEETDKYPPFDPWGLQPSE